MVAITRKVADLTSALRRALEDAVGQPLRDEQQIMIQVRETGYDSIHRPASGQGGADPGALPEWCRVYDGLSEEQATRLDAIVHKRAELGRSFE